MRRITLGDRLRYRFDNIMSKGPAALIWWLAAITLVFIFLIALIVVSTGIAQGQGDEKMGLIEIGWMSLMRTLDAGTMGGDTGTPAFLLCMLIVTLWGIFMVSALVGLLSNSLQNRIEDLRKGRSFVVERGHSLILGWSPQVFTIVSELVTANENQKSACIVILAEKDKVEMEDEIRSRVGPTGKTRVVCRTGNPLDLTELEIANPGAARSIVVLAPEGADPDAHVLKTLLALTNGKGHLAEQCHIVAGIQIPRNIELGRIAGQGAARLIQVNSVITRIVAQTCRQSGLSIVYTELLNFDGDEIYFASEPALTGKTFSEALSAYEDSAVIGLHFADGRTELNPPMDTRVANGDQIIAITADDDKLVVSARPAPAIDETAIVLYQPTPVRPEKTLILGWNHQAAAIITELDNYVAPGSKITVAANTTRVSGFQIPAMNHMNNQAISFVDGDTSERDFLERLAVPDYDHIVVLNYSDALSPQDADSLTLMTLLQLRDMSEKCGRQFSIVSEMLDVRNRELAEVTHADDFIVSDQLISLLFAQISENKHLMEVFDDLFDSDGSEIYLKPAEQYIKPGHRVNFYAVLEAARRRGETAIGYRLLRNAHLPEQDYGVVINPHKSDSVAFAPGDRIIVLADN